jgi:hypothetical protein
MCLLWQFSVRPLRIIRKFNKNVNLAPINYVRNHFYIFTLPGVSTTQFVGCLRQHVHHQLILNLKFASVYEKVAVTANIDCLIDYLKFEID